MVNHQASILIVDDEQSITSAIHHYLSEAGYETAVAHTGQDAFALLVQPFDLVILDIMLPDTNGYEICKHIRQSPAYTPILMLTAKDTLEEKIVGLDLGADGYMTKPYNPQELLAQVRALLRLANKQTAPQLTCNGLALSLDSGVVTRHGETIQLTGIEFDILSLLMQNPNQVFGRETLLRKVWGYEAEAITSRTVDTHIQRLRAKIEDDPKQPEFLITVRGFGYRMICSDKT